MGPELSQAAIVVRKIAHENRIEIAKSFEIRSSNYKSVRVRAPKWNIDKINPSADAPGSEKSTDQSHPVAALG